MKQPCGCCAGIRVLAPEPEANRPGLDAIVYRVGTYGTFMETMLAQLSNPGFDVQWPPGSLDSIHVRPLFKLTTRETSDPAIALLDAWAVVADVLTFYQERIANEGYLPTATERRSVLELSRLIGYRLRPGVASSVSLAFTVAADFKGVIPAGTRAQSIPSTGETAQFFETSEELPARDSWNYLAPRVTRPQVIAPPKVVAKTSIPIVTGVDVIDTVYFAGITTNLRVGDALVFVFGSDSGQQFTRTVESVTPQPDDKRTEVGLVQTLPEESANAASSLQPFIDKAAYMFEGSDLAQELADILKTLATNIGIVSDKGSGANLIRGVVAQVNQRRDIAFTRGFTRVVAWIDHLLQLLDTLIRLALDGSLGDMGEGDTDSIPVFVPSSLAASPLAKLGAIVQQLALAPSLQPVNSRRLIRSIAQSFSPQSDAAPRLLAAFKPAAAPALYHAWTKAETPSSRIDVQAARVKATLFASSFMGPPTVPAHGGTVTFENRPTIVNSWTGLVPHNTDGHPTGAPTAVALDSAYDQIKVGSWVIIDQPVLDANDVATSRAVTVHRVVALRTQSLDTTHGYSAKATLLTLYPQWLGKPDGATLTLLERNAFLRGTVVYAQTESLALTEEPLDTDVEGGTIELDGLYDGLEGGRWIIVSGNRTDVPNVSSVAASELVMISGVAQGARAPLAVDFPQGLIPFSKVFYTTDANALGDRLVVGQLDPKVRKSISPATAVNQQYRDQVELAPGLHVNAYVPTQQELAGDFGDFAGLLVDPETNLPFPEGRVGDKKLKAGIFAWRISSQKLHTILTLANPLAYKYDTRTIRIYGNVVKATHGQTVGEVLGDGDTSTAFQRFALRQSPLTLISAPTPVGADTTLIVRVNDIEWYEADALSAVGPRDRSFVTARDDAEKTSVVFGNGTHGARLPSGSANVKATYRYGIGKPGNVRAGQISQLATHPLGAQGVLNPLPATGGADSDGRDQARRNAPLAVMALDRLVSVQDYADFARTFAGVGKASAVRLSDGQRSLVHLTIAGVDDIPIDRTSDLYRNLLTSLQRNGNPHLPIAVCLRKVGLLIIAAAVRLLDDYVWESVEPKLRHAMLAAFGFDRRELGQPAFLSEALAALQGVEGVSYVNVETFDSVREDVSAAELAGLAATLGRRESVAAQPARMNTDVDLSGVVHMCQRVLPAELVFLTPDIPSTLILRQTGT